MIHTNSVLVVDDDEAFRTRLLQAFQARGFEARGAHNADSARALALEDSPEFALVDLKVPGASGLSVVRALHAVDATTRIVVLTGHGSISTAVEAMRAGAHHYLTKPAELSERLRAFGDATPATDELGTDAQAPSLARMEWEVIQCALTDHEVKYHAGSEINWNPSPFAATQTREISGRTIAALRARKR